MRIEQALKALKEAGFTPRGGFYPAPEDGVPEVDRGRPARAVLLVGNAGPDMWARFTSECDPDADLLDDWSRKRLNDVATYLGGRALFPFMAPTLPFQRWAQKAEACHISPLGLAIHPDYGLWHGYRGAIALAEELDLPLPDSRPSPCDSCRDRPCLTACPVSAFTGTSYDVAACARHLDVPAGVECMSRGCLARHACPIGRDYAYSAEQAQFHMRAYLRGRREEKTI